MRLSIIVRNNLEKDADGQEYHAASSNGATSGDVKLNHTDAELDFEEQATDAAGVLLDPRRPCNSSTTWNVTITFCIVLPPGI